MSNKAYWRRLVVRAIEDACILLMMGVGIWGICSIAESILVLLGVG